MVKIDINEFVDENWSDYDKEIDNLIASIEITKPLTRTDKLNLKKIMKTSAKIQLSLWDKANSSKTD